MKFYAAPTDCVRENPTGGHVGGPEEYQVCEFCCAGQRTSPVESSPVIKLMVKRRRSSFAFVPLKQGPVLH